MLSSASIALNTAYAAQNGKTNKTYETIAAVRGAYSFGTYPSIQPWAVRCSVLWCSCIRGRTCEDDLVDAAFHVFTGNPHEFTANAAMASSSLWRRARLAPRVRAASTGDAGARSAHAISATHARRAMCRGNLIVGAADERSGALRENSAGVRLAVFCSWPAVPPRGRWFVVTRRTRRRPRAAPLEMATRDPTVEEYAIRFVRKYLKVSARAPPRPAPRARRPAPRASPVLLAEGGPTPLPAPRASPVLLADTDAPSRAPRSFLAAG